MKQLFAPAAPASDAPRAPHAHGGEPLPVPLLDASFPVVKSKSEAQSLGRPLYSLSSWLCTRAIEPESASSCLLLACKCSTTAISCHLMSLRHTQTLKESLKQSLSNVT